MDWKRRALELFEQAFDLPADQIDAFLAKSCGDDSRLAREVRALLDARSEVLFDEFDTDPLDNSATCDPPTGATRPFDSARERGRFLPGTEFSQRYRIVSLVGEGAMGEVYRADDLKLGHPVAIKILPPEIACDARRLEYFHNEVRLARQISHPNVCRVYDIGEADNLHFLSMEYVDGEDLRTLLRRIGRLPPDKGVEVAQQICAGLASAHDVNVIHRDLKPSNIMIDGQGRVRITDFGLARSTNENENAEIAGTPSYMAPEQLAQGTANIGTDIFSLGLVLHELFTGEAVFQADSLAQLRQLHDDSHIERSSSIRDVSPLVESAIRSCLERDPAHRATSVREVAAALPGGEPLAAALAAGQLPSPAQVAASGGVGGLDLRMAAVLLGAVVLGLLSIVATSGSSVINRAGLKKHPQILIDQARELVKAFGYTDTPIDADWGMEVDRSAPERGSPTRSGDDPLALHRRYINFWYRQSPSTLAPISIRDGNWRNPGHVTYHDPALTTGMTRLVLDASGRLLRFEGMPSTNAMDPSIAETFPWKTVFHGDLADALGFAPDTLEQTKPTFVPPVAFDQRYCWLATYPDGTNAEVEAASFGHQLVHFQITSVAKQAGPALTAISRRAALYLVILTVSALVSWYNYSAGLGDAIGAKRLAQFAFLGNLAVFALVGSHSTSSLVEGPLVQHGVAMAAFAAIEHWLYYMALEPLVRRLWPRNLITWYRVLAGRFRDPLVGHRILVGVLAALVLRLMKPLSVLVSEQLGQMPPIPLQMTVWPLKGVAYSGAGIITSLLYSVQLGLTYLLSFVVLRMILRRPSLALVSFVILWTGVFMQFGGLPPVGVVFLGLATLLKGAALLRYGLLSLISILFVERLLEWPITTDTSAWYFATGLVGILLVAMLAVYSGYVAVGGRRKLFAL